MFNTFIIEPCANFHKVIQEAKASFQTIRAYQEDVSKSPEIYVHTLRSDNANTTNIIKSIFGSIIVEYYSSESICNLYTRIALRASAIHLVVLPIKHAAELLSVEKDIENPTASYMIEGW